MTAKTNVLLPMETINRELDGRLWLGCLYANKSNRIFIGQHNVLERLVRGLRGGIYLGKNMFTRVFPHDDLVRYRTLKEHGFVVIHLDEEGAVFSGDAVTAKWFLGTRLDPRCLAADDYVCTWGDFQREFYSSLQPRCVNNIRTTGHPRFDLYRPEYRSYFAADSRAIRARYGQFVLINTNRGYANNGLGLADTFSASNDYDPGNPAARLNYVGLWAHDVAIVTNLVKLVHRLSVEFPALNFVLRPHPAEDRSYYATVLRGVDNVIVAHEGAVGPWLLACMALIHDGCTTGIEAYLTGTPTINYKSVENPRYDLFLPNLFGERCDSEEAVVEQIHALRAATTPAPPRARFTEEVHRLMVNFRHDATRKVMEVMAEAEQGAQEPSACRDVTIALSEGIRTARDGAKSLVRPLFRERHRWYKFFRQSHFYGFTPAMVAPRIRTIEGLVHKRLRWKLYSDSLLSIESHE